MSFNNVEQFEEKIAAFFGSSYCITTDSCTHAIELCLRYLQSDQVFSPKHTYISVPFTFEKLNLDWSWRDHTWSNYYYINDQIIDAAVYWKENGYIPNTFMCVSFQFKKHLGLGRGGCILTDSKTAYYALKPLTYDGRDLNTPWAEQNIKQIGYHYYMTPETAALGLEKLPTAITTTPKIWSWKDYPDLTRMEVFK